MKKMCLSFSLASAKAFALAAMVFTPYVPVHGNERAPYDPVVEICPGVPTVSSQMEKIAHSVDLQKEACELYAQFQPSDKKLDVSDPEGDLLRLYVLTHGGKKGVIKQIETLRLPEFPPEL